MILDELSDCAPAPAGSGTLQTRPFDLVELAEAVLARPVPAAAARLSVFVDSELRTGALGDPGRLGRVLDRLAGAMLAESRPAPLRLEVLPVPAPAAAGATRRIRFLFLAEGGAAPARPDPDCREDAALMGGEIGLEPGADGAAGLWLELPLPPAPTVRRWILLPAVASARVLVADRPGGTGEGGELRRLLQSLGLQADLAPDPATAAAWLAAAREAGAPPYRLLFLDAGDGAALPAQLRQAAGDTRLVAVADAAMAVAGLPADLPWAARLSRPLRLGALLACVERFAMPAAAPEPPLPDLSPAPPPETAPDGAAPLRVLLVEDNEMNLRVLQAFLSRPEYRLAVAQTGREAVAAVAEEVFDVVLMDLRMPDMDGAEATRRIRALPAPRGAVHVIAVTADATERAEQRCREAGMDDYLAKPVPLAALQAKLDALRARAPGRAGDGAR